MHACGVLCLRGVVLQNPSHEAGRQAPWGGVIRSLFPLICPETNRCGHSMHVRRLFYNTSPPPTHTFFLIAPAVFEKTRRRQDKASEALMDAQRCVEVNPSWAKGYSRMGTALFRLGKHDKAATAYSKGELALSPAVRSTA